ncbi:MAG: prepilin peptidase [Candidatus Aminicenantes bacterium]|jgi:leader peptidase (prepilin peptidase)/N-methyltransferase
MEKIILIVVFGLVWGSFLNVVIYRLPRGLSLLRPPSSCPHCGKHIKAYQNIPILSYLVLRGKCGFCGAKISPVYPLVEALTSLCFLLVYGQHALSPHFFVCSLFVSALIVLGFIDYAHQILPDEITLPGFVLALVYTFFRSDLSIAQALIGAGVGAGFLLLVYGVYYLLRKKEGLGLGDVTMMLMVGAFLGWKQTLLTLILASLGGAVVGVIFIVFKKKNLQHALPFGTFLAPAAFVALLYGLQIIEAYLSLYRQP